MNLRPTWQLIAATALLVATGATAACTDGSASADVLAATATPTAAVQTVVATATAIPPTAVPAVTAAPTATPDPLQDIELVKEVHTRFMTELFARDERIPQDVERYLALAQELTTGIQLETLLTRLPERQERNEYLVNAGYISSILEIRILADGQVEVLDCSIGQGSLLDGEGAVLVAPSGDRKLRSTTLTHTREGWKVNDFKAGGNPTCDPVS